MKLRGRRHWTSKVTVNTIQPGTGANTGVDTWTPDSARVDLPAAVQSMDRASLIKHGIEASEERYWVRVGPEAGTLTPLVTGFTMLAASGQAVKLRVTSENAGSGLLAGEDSELICQVEM